MGGAPVTSPAGGVKPANVVTARTKKKKKKSARRCHGPRRVPSRLHATVYPRRAGPLSFRTRGASSSETHFWRRAAAMSDTYCSLTLCCARSRRNVLASWARARARKRTHRETDRERELRLQARRNCLQDFFFSYDYFFFFAIVFSPYFGPNVEQQVVDATLPKRGTN